ncbi:inhibitor of nuclear factor kappa-B kinase subunit beta-like [Clytia hemisphaerica]
MGSGGFGSVTAWINQTNGDKMVIKQCKSALNERNRERWLEEIHLMNTIKHKNVVSGRKVPEEIDKFIRGPEKLLGLEFCESDLRKLLGRRIHCCGLREQSVLDVLRDVSCGLQFLHKQPIIHRDLKPENILLSQQTNKTVFKITDLGYAKVMDANSIAMSFVGTIQYLAPELYDRNSGYKYTADFWSLGTLIFECITGHRPFVVPNKAYDWPKYMRQKSDDHIWGAYDEHTQSMNYYRDIPTPNQLSKPLVDAFCEWLKLVLRFDAKHRGNKQIQTHDGHQMLECFYEIQQILHKRIINVFEVLKCQKHSYVLRPGDTGSTLKMFLLNELSIEMEDQLIVFPNHFKLLDDNASLAEQCSDIVQEVFLFDTSAEAKFEISSAMLDKVRELLGNPEEKRKGSELRSYWAQSLFYCLSKANDYAMLLKSQKALLNNIQKRWEHLQHQKELLQRTAIKLEATVDMFKLSYECDRTNRPETYGKAGHDCLHEWGILYNKIENITSHTQLDVLYAVVEQKKEKIKAGLQSTSQSNRNPLEDIASQVGDKYDRLREKIRDIKMKDFLHDSTAISNMLWNCVAKRDTLYTEFYRGLRKALVLDKEISQAVTEVQNRIHAINNDIAKVQSYQKARQCILWKLLASNAAISSLDGSIPFSSLPDLLEESLTVKIPQESPKPIEMDMKFRSAMSNLDQLIGSARPKTSPKRSFTIDSASLSPTEFDVKFQQQHNDKRRQSEPVHLSASQSDNGVFNFDTSPARTNQPFTDFNTPSAHIPHINRPLLVQTDRVPHLHHESTQRYPTTHQPVPNNQFHGNRHPISVSPHNRRNDPNVSLTVTQGQLPATAIPSPRSSPRPHAGALQTSQHVQNFTIGGSVVKMTGSSTVPTNNQTFGTNDDKTNQSLSPRR